MIRNLLPMLVELPVMSLVLLKITLILGLGWLMHSALSSLNARWTVLLWRLVAVGVLCVPLIVLLMPAIEFTVSNIQSPTVTSQASTSPHSLTSTDAAGLPIDNSAGNPSAQVNSSKSADATRINFRAAIFMIWAFVFAVLLAKLLIAMRRIQRLLRASTHADDTAQATFDVLCRNFHIKRQVRLRVSRELFSPVLCGFRNPTILLPAHMTHGDYAKELPAIFAHELTHLRGRDLEWMTLLHLLSTTLWFHPLVWRISAAHAAACETVCDAVAAGYVGSPQVYSRTLARLALDMIKAPPAVGGAAMARSAEITRRLNLLKKKLTSDPLGRRQMTTAIIGVTTLISFISVIRVVAAEVPQTPPTTIEKAIQGTLSTDPLMSAESLRLLLAADRSELKLIADNLHRSEPVRSPFAAPDLNSTIWYPTQAFTHRLGASASEEQCAESLARTHPLGEVLEFYLKLATGRKGEGFTRQDWQKAIDEIPAQPAITAPKLPDLKALRLTVSSNYKSLSAEQRLSERYTAPNSKLLRDAFAAIANYELYQEAGIIGKSHCYALDISDDLSTAWSVVRISKGIVSIQTKDDLIKAAMSADIPMLRDINYWNPEERIYQLNLLTGEYAMLLSSPGTALALQSKLGDFVKSDKKIKTE